LTRERWATAARATFVAIFFSVSSANADDWPHWRGPFRNGLVSEDSGWRRGAWLPDKPLWTGNAGIGSSSPLVVAGKVYVLGWKDGKDQLACLAADSGKTLWTVSYACPQYGRHKNGDEGMYSGPSSTPEYDPASGFIYTLSTDGDLHCWDTRKQGAKIWGFNLYDRYQAPRRPRVGTSGLRDYGYTSSPLVHGEKVLVEVGAKEGNLVAFSKRSGQRLWTSECRDPAGHNGGPAPIMVEGIPCLAVLTFHRLIVLRLDPGHEGKTIAEYPWETDFGNNIASPTVHDHFVLITSSYNHQAICKLRITLQGAIKEWEAPYSSSVCSPVVHKGHVYFAWRTLRCLDFATGKQKWSGGSFGDPGSCIVTKDDRLVVWGLRGKLILAETAERSPNKYQELASRDGLGSDHAWPHVVLADGRLLCKDRAGNMKCWRIGQ
jgi:outer membrane protein assembly factor BamB